MYKNIIWDLVGKFGIQIVSFLLSIILTRLLSPTEYGIMGMVMVIVGFAHIFLDLGFYRAIIQRPEVSPTQYSTIFYVNTGMAVLLALACFFGAGPLARFYGQPLITPIFQVASISFLINGLNLIPGAMLYKKMRFKVNSIQSLASAVISGVIGVLMAYNGFGVWSLLAQSLLGSFILLVLNWLYVGWWPTWQFSIAAIRPMWAYGSRMFASGVLDTLYTRLDTFIIAKIFNPATLGFYARAQGMDNMVRQFSAGSIVGSLFPYIAKHQDDRPLVKQIYERYLHIVLFISVGISGALFLVAKDLFTFLFTARWIYAAELFQILALMGFAFPASSLMCTVISSLGNSKAFFRLEVIKKVLILPVYVFGFFWGLKGFIALMCVAVYVAVIINTFYVSKEISSSALSQIKAIGTYLVCGVAICGLIHFAQPFYRQESLLANIIITSAFFGSLYAVAVFALRLPGVQVIQVGFNKLKVAFQ